MADINVWLLYTSAHEYSDFMRGVLRLCLSPTTQQLSSCNITKQLPLLFCPEVQLQSQLIRHIICFFFCEIFFDIREQKYTHMAWLSAAWLSAILQNLISSCGCMPMIQGDLQNYPVNELPFHVTLCLKLISLGNDKQPALLFRLKDVLVCVCVCVSDTHTHKYLAANLIWWANMPLKKCFCSATCIKHLMRYPNTTVHSFRKKGCKISHSQYHFLLVFSAGSHNWHSLFYWT